MFNYRMELKGLTEKQTNIETPNDIITEKPLKSDPIAFKRVDINVLKSKLQDNQNKEFRKNLTIFIFFLVALGSLGIYLST